MPEVFVGTEDISFLRIGTPDISTSGFYRDTAFSRCALRGRETQGWRAAWSSALMEGWLSCRVATTFSSEPNHNDPIILLRDSALGTELFRVRPVAGILSAEYWDGSAWQRLSTTHTGYTGNTPFRLDLHWKVDGSEGVLDLFIGGTLVATYGGDTDHVGGITGITQADFRGLLWASASSINDCYFSEVIVADEDTRDWRLMSLYPNGAGTYSEGTGAYTDVDEVSVSDADIISFDADGKRTSVALNNVSSSLSGLVIGNVHVHARARRNGSGPQVLELGVRGSSTDGYSDPLALDTTYATVRAEFPANPGTGVAPTAGQLDDYEFILRANT